MKTDFLNHHVIEQGQTARHLVSWGSLIAGLLLTLLSFSGLLALGVAIGGISLSDGTTAQRAGIFTGIWFILSAVISLFAGSYVCVRLGKFRNDIVGVAHGIVIASLFILLLMNQTATAVGWLSRAAGDAAGGAASMIGTGVNSAANSPAVNDMIENAVGDLNLKADPKVVVTGVASRLIRGDTESAKVYLARQAGVSEAEVEQRIATLRTQVDQAVIQAREAAADAMKATGWSVFLLIVLGAVSGALGGLLASQVNFRKPLALASDEAITNYSNTVKV